MYAIHRTICMLACSVSIIRGWQSAYHNFRTTECPTSRSTTLLPTLKRYTAYLPAVLPTLKRYTVHLSFRRPAVDDLLLNIKEKERCHQEARTARTSSTSASSLKELDAGKYARQLSEISKTACAI